MFSALSPTYKGILLALAGYTGFSFADACAKWLTQSYSVYQVVAIDTAIASVGLLLLAPWLGGMGDLFRRENLKINILRAFLNFLINIIVVYSFTQLPLSAAYTAIFAKPLLAALLVIPLYGEVLTRPRLLSILLGFLGVIIAFQPGAESFNWVLVIPLFGAFIIALMFVISRSLKDPSVFTLGFFPMAGSCLLTIPFAVMTYEPVMLDHIWIFIAQSLFLATGIVCVSLAFRIAAAAAVGPFLYTQMIWALIFGYLIFGDVPDIWMMTGAAVIIVSGFYLIETERRERKYA